MTYFSAKSRPELVEQNKLSKSILPPKKNMVIGIDESYLDFESHRAMIAGLSLIDVETFTEKKELNVLVLGAGLCSLSKFIFTHFGNTKVVSIEILKSVVEVAKTHFAIDKDPRFKIIIDNAFSYVKNLPVHEDPHPCEEVKEVEKLAEETNKSAQEIDHKESVGSKGGAPKVKQYDIIIIDILSS